MYKTEEIFDLNHTIAKDYFNENPWEIIPKISDIILKIGKTLPKEYKEVKENIWIHESATVFDTAYIAGPCIIGKRTEIRHCAFIRGNALIGDDVVVGNSVELKNVILFDECQVPHFNYVGDSVLGYKAHMGAGSITSNVKADRNTVVIHSADNDISTGMKKMGALIGDRGEIGCNAVLNPGSVVGKDSNVYPLSCFRGVLRNGHIYKSSEKIVEKK